MVDRLPNPRRDVPRAIAAQLGLGSIYAFCFAIAILYGITDLDAVLDAPGSFPLAEIYAQATGSRAATFGLLFIVFLSLTPCLIGTFLTVSRTFEESESGLTNVGEPNMVGISTRQCHTLCQTFLFSQRKTQLSHTRRDSDWSLHNRFRCHSSGLAYCFL